MPPPADITEEKWNQIVAVYQKHSGRMRAVAAELGWPLARTQRRWALGYPSLGFPPIKTLMARDSFSMTEIRAERANFEKRLPQVPLVSELPKENHARAVVISTAEQLRLEAMVRRESERERARQDAIKSRAAEATLVSINRGNAIALNAMTASLLHGASKLSHKIQQELEQEAKVSTLSLSAKLHLVRAAASIARFNSEATVMAVKAERLVLNTPIDVDEETPDAGSLDEAAEWIEKANTAIARARARGLLKPPPANGGENGGRGAAR